MVMLPKLTRGQSLAYDFARGAFSRGLGANEALRAWQELGGAVRRQDFLSLYRYVGGVTKAGYDVQNVRHEYFPSYKDLPDSLTDIRRNYSFDVRIGWTGEYDELGNPIGSYVTVTTDKELRVQEILDLADEYVAEEQDKYGEVEYAEPVIVTARKRGEF